MKTTQLIISDLPVNPLDEAVMKVRDLALPHPNYTEFVREVAENVLGQRDGAVLLCAAPAGIDCDELIVSISEDLDTRHRAREGTPFAGLQVIATPSSLRRGSGAASLFDAYHNPIEKPGTCHQFALNYGEVFRGRDAFHVVSNLVKSVPAGAYVVKNAHALQTGQKGIEGAIQSVLTFAEIARHSKRTHILIGHTSIVLDWLADPMIAREVCPFVLAPYDTDENQTDFREVLRAYDRILPWKDGDSLEANFKEVDDVVFGSPHRLRKWLVTSLCKARAESGTELDWDRFISRQLPRCERIEAWNELNSVRRYRDLDYDSEVAGNAEIAAPKLRRKRKCPPGIRNPIRDASAAA